MTFLTAPTTFRYVLSCSEAVYPSSLLLSLSLSSHHINENKGQQRVLLSKRILPRGPSVVLCVPVTTRTQTNRRRVTKWPHPNAPAAIQWRIILWKEKVCGYVLVLWRVEWTNHAFRYCGQHNFFATADPPTKEFHQIFKKDL
jgi:hypothetical protein